MFIDTHTHLYADTFSEDRDLIIQKAIEAGVTKMLLPNIDKDSWFKPSSPQINILKAPNKIGAGRKVELLHAKAYHHLSLSKYCC